jgi:hypothetical protein
MTGITPNNVNNTIRIPCTKDSIFRYWLKFTIPFHNLTSREIDVATAFLKERHKLSKVILDSALVDRTLMSEESQRNLRQECGLTYQHFQVIKNKLKNKKFFTNDTINPRLIPNVREDDTGCFQLLLLFDYEK